MELKRAFFKENKKSEDIFKQINLMKTFLIDKQISLGESSEGKIILEKRRLIENLDSMFKEVYLLFHYFSL